MPTQSIIPVTPGSGLDLDAVSLVIGANTVFREVLVIADPTNPTSLAGVTVGGALQVDGSATIQPVSGTFFQATQPVSIAGAVTVSQATAANLNATVVGTGTFVVQATLSAGSAVIGHVIVDSGTLAVTNAGTFTVQASITTLGQALAAASVPVVLTAAQLTTLTPLTSVAVTNIGTFAVQAAGTLTNNSAAPSTNNIGALGFLANAADPTFTEGDLVTGSITLAGYQRVILHAETTKVIGTINIAASQTVAVTNTGTFVVQATLAAETTKVIGTVNQGTNPWVVSGAVTTSGTATVIGTLTNNNAAPAATNVGALTAIANAAAPTNTEGDQVLNSQDLQGSSRIRPGSPKTANWSQAAISVNALGANVIVAGIGGQTVRIMRMFFVNSDPATTVNVTIQDTTPTSFSGAFRLITAGSFNGTDANGEPLYVSAVGKGIQLNIDVAVQLSGTVWFTQSA